MTLLQTASILEVGCGAGNTFFPLVQDMRERAAAFYASDFSAKAVELVKSNELFDSNRCHAFVADLSEANALQSHVEPESMDVVMLIFVLSALHPSKMKNAIDSIFKVLKPGGLVLFRDYGKLDLAQLRFKKGRMISDDFYVRGDNTRVFFFTDKVIRDLFSSSGFAIEQCAADRRLLVNRIRKLQMYRIWYQGKFRKPINAGTSKDI